MSSLGNNLIFYDRLVVEKMKSMIAPWWRLTYYYASNWRVLRIDGFEGFIFARDGRLFHSDSIQKRQFFNYEIHKEEKCR